MAEEPDYSRDVDQSASSDAGDALHQQLSNDQIYEGNDRVKAYTDGLKDRDYDQRQLGEEESPEHAIARNEKHAKAPNQKADESADLAADAATSVGGGARGVTQPGLPPDASQLVDNARDYVGGRAADRVPRASNQATGAQIYGHNVDGIGDVSGESHLLPKQARMSKRAPQRREHLRKMRQERLQNRLRARRNRERELAALDQSEAAKDSAGKVGRNAEARERQQMIRENKARQEYQKRLDDRVVELGDRYARKSKTDGQKKDLLENLQKAKLAANFFRTGKYQPTEAGSKKLQQDVERQYAKKQAENQAVDERQAKQDVASNSNVIDPNDPKVVEARAMRDALKKQIADQKNQIRLNNSAVKNYQRDLDTWNNVLQNSKPDSARQLFDTEARNLFMKTGKELKDINAITPGFQEHLDRLSRDSRDRSGVINDINELVGQFDKVTKTKSPELRDKIYESGIQNYQQLLQKLKNRQKRYFEQSDRLSQSGIKSSWAHVKPQDRTPEMVGASALNELKIQHLDLLRDTASHTYRELVQNCGHDKSIEVPKNMPIQLTNSAIQQVNGQHNARMLPATVSKGAKFDSKGEESAQNSKRVTPTDADLDKASENAKKVEDAFNNPMLTKYLEQNMEMMKTMQEEIKALHQEINNNAKKHDSAFKKIKHNFAKNHEKMQHVKTGDMLYELAYRGTSRLVSFAKTTSRYALAIGAGALHIGGKVNHHAKRKVNETVHAINEGTIANVDAGLDPAAAQKMQAQHQKDAQKNAKKQAAAQKGGPGL